MKIFKLLIVLISLIPLACTTPTEKYEKLTITLTPPEGHKPGESIHTIGNFNNWELDGNNSSQFKKIKDNSIDRDNLFFNFVKKIW